MIYDNVYRQLNTIQTEIPIYGIELGLLVGTDVGVVGTELGSTVGSEVGAVRDKKTNKHKIINFVSFLLKTITLESCIGTVQSKNDLSILTCVMDLAGINGVKVSILY